MDCIAREKGFVAEDDLFGSLDGGRIDGEDFVDDSRQGIEGGLNRIRPLDGNAAPGFVGAGPGESPGLRPATPGAALPVEGPIRHSA